MSLPPINTDQVSLTTKPQNGADVWEKIAASTIGQEKILEDMEAQLGKKREDCKARHELYLIKSQELDEKYSQFEARKQKFEKFIMENDLKRKKAISRMQSEQKMTMQKAQEIKALDEAISKHQKRVEDTGTMIVKCRVYEDYLASVVKLISIEDIPQLLARYQTLKQASHELNQRLAQVNTDIDNTRLELADTQRRIADEHLSMSAQKGQLQYKLETMRSQSVNLKQKYDLQSSGSKEYLKELATVVFAVDNLFVRVEQPLLPGKETTDMSVIENSAMRYSLTDKISRIQQRVGDIAKIIDKTRAIMKQERKERQQQNVQEEKAAAITTTVLKVVQVSSLDSNSSRRASIISGNSGFSGDQK